MKMKTYQMLITYILYTYQTTKVLIMIGILKWVVKVLLHGILLNLLLLLVMP